MKKGNAGGGKRRTESERHPEGKRERKVCVSSRKGKRGEQTRKSKNG